MSDKKSNVMTYIVLACFLGILIATGTFCSGIEIRNCNGKVVIISKGLPCAAN